MAKDYKAFTVVAKGRLPEIKTDVEIRLAAKLA